MMFFKKRKKPDAAKPAPAAMSKPAPNADFFASLSTKPSVPAQQPAPQTATVSSIAIADLSELRAANGKPTRASVVGDWYAFAANQIGISAESMPAKEGDEFLATATIATLESGARNETAQFGFGPIFLDAEGKVVRWFRVYYQPGQDAAELQSKGRAPAGAASVKLAIRGPKSDQAEGVYTIGARNLNLRKSA